MEQKGKLLMAKITEITYGYKFGRPGYSSEDISLTAQLDDSDDATLEMLRLREQVMLLGGDDSQIRVSGEHLQERETWLNGKK